MNTHCVLRFAALLLMHDNLEAALYCPPEHYLQAELFSDRGREMLPHSPGLIANTKRRQSICGGRSGGGGGREGEVAQ